MSTRALARRLTLALLAAVGLVASASAVAHTQSFKSTITIQHEDGSPKYKGRVISSREACEQDRIVKLHTAQGDVIAETTSNDQGHWKHEFIGERYYARVVRRVDGSGEHRHVCLADRSPTTPN